MIVEEFRFGFIVYKDAVRGMCMVALSKMPADIENITRADLVVPDEMNIILTALDMSLNSALDEYGETE